MFINIVDTICITICVHLYAFTNIMIDSKIEMGFDRHSFQKCIWLIMFSSFHDYSLHSCQNELCPNYGLHPFKAYLTSAITYIFVKKCLASTMVLHSHQNPLNLSYNWKYFFVKGELLWSSKINEPNIFANCKDKQINHKKFNFAYYNYMWRTFELGFPILFFFVTFICKMIFNAIIVLNFS